MSNDEILSLAAYAIAAVAMIVANLELNKAAREVERALRAIETLSSLNSDSLTKIHLSTPDQSRLWKWFSTWRKRRTLDIPCDSQKGIMFLPYDGTDIESSNVQADAPLKAAPVERRVRG